MHRINNNLNFFTRHWLHPQIWFIVDHWFAELWNWICFESKDNSWHLSGKSFHLHWENCCLRKYSRWSREWEESWHVLSRLQSLLKWQLKSLLSLMALEHLNQTVILSIEMRFRFHHIKAIKILTAIASQRKHSRITFLSPFIFLITQCHESLIHKNGERISDFVSWSWFNWKLFLPSFLFLFISSLSVYLSS